MWQLQNYGCLSIREVLVPNFSRISILFSTHRYQAESSRQWNRIRHYIVLYQSYSLVSSLACPWLSEVNGTSQWTFFDLLTLTLPRYLSSWPPCQSSSLYVCLGLLRAHYTPLQRYMGYLCTRKAQYAPPRRKMHHGAQGRLYFLKNSGDPDEWVTWLIYRFTSMNGSHCYNYFRFKSIFHTYEKLVVQKLLSYDCE